MRKDLLHALPVQGVKLTGGSHATGSDDKECKGYDETVQRTASGGKDSEGCLLTSFVHGLNSRIPKSLHPHFSLGRREEAHTREGQVDHPGETEGRGSEFYANKNEDKTHGTSQFTLRLRELGIEHILCRVNHPQTNGKLERVHGDIEKRWTRFDADIHKIVSWQNTVKPHMSLKFNRGETPDEAFVRKYPAERVVATIAPWFWS